MNKWKGTVEDIREKGYIPTLHPDFGDGQRGARNDLSSGGQGIHAAIRHSNIKEKCHI